MSIFNELLPKINEISIAYAKNFNDDLKAITECFDKFEEEYQNGRRKTREKGQKDKNLVTTLQSIHEDDDESTKTPEDNPKRLSNGKSKSTESRSSSESNSERRLSNKRNKNEVDGLLSPEQDKRQKRNASVNVNLTQKMRREEPEKSRGRRRKEDDKENEPDFTNVQIKEEKVSLPPEPMDLESLPINIEVKQEANKDEIAMPPPAAPVPKPRKVTEKTVKEKTDDNEKDTSRRSRRNTKTRKQTDTMPPPAAPVVTAARASSRRRDADDPPAPSVAESRPKRTRAKKKVSETSPSDTEKDTTQTQVNSADVTPDKPRPKRTRRGQKAAEKEQAKPEEPKSEEPKPEEPKPEEPKPVEEPKQIEPEPVLKEERVSEPQSPILPQKVPQKENKNKEIKSRIPVSDKREATPEAKVVEPETANALDETRVIQKLDTMVTIDMDKTVVLPNGVYNHAPVTPNDLVNMNATVVIEPFNRETIVLEKQNAVMDCTVVLDKEPKEVNISEDSSIMTEDNSDVVERTPPKPVPIPQPTSAVKERVQQFEELASRVTRTKTRAMAKKEEDVETQTPPDKVSKVILSAETLSKMNSLIFSGNPIQISSSASKPRANVPVPVKTVPASASKVSAVNRAREEDSLKREKEDARKKKEALLEAKREQQRRKREEKMAAAAATRSAAERERAAQLSAAARGREEKRAHAQLGKLHRIQEAERKKQENARKAAEIEERRRVEELRVKQRLEEELRREAARRRQLEEAEATKKEAALMAKEIEKRQKEYLEKHRIKQKMEDRMHNTPLKPPPPLEPAYMSDGFQYLNSDEEEDAVDRPVPAWSTSKARKQQLATQTQLRAALVERLFCVRRHSPDLREIFPGIDRSRLKRTSSAVWRTPPQRLPKVAE
ncbi:titin homolog isoform X2 [Plodia interpunctella]|uniref:titin homolog isoform X2 n=1 Tax=Plodia interpunctella TaxID=58824 RepID=UPI0023684123|nr:titin homolog isoform X2 [Plodia interpunctella]